MPIFEKRYVHFMWDDLLENVEGFFADTIANLRMSVEFNVRTQYGKIKSADNKSPYTFSYDDKTSFKFFYYDPNYELKVAREEGKTIQVLYGSDWYDITPDYELIDNETYRIEPKSKLEEEKPITYRELAMWLSKGNGGFFLECEHIGGHSLFYTSHLANEPVPERFLIRKWEDSEWVKPTREYMGLDG